MRAVRQMDKETAMTTAGREMKIRQLSVSRTIDYILYTICVRMCMHMCMCMCMCMRMRMCMCMWSALGK